MRTTGRWTSFIRAACGGVLGAVLAAAPAGAQTTTGTIRGNVTGDNGAPVEGATILARNVDIGADRGAVTNDQGFYNLAGLRPGRYAITVRRIGFSATADSLTVMVGQTITRNYQLRTANVQLQTVVVTAAPVTETRTSEIATNVTRKQLEELPTADRNFMSLAQLAPGVTVQNDKLDGQRKTFSAGAQGPEQVNVFIDGASYKNDILQGGVAGQDASRGNPFPRNAVQEYRVLTQNYKAEYQKASSAIIAATTRTGGTTWTGNVFFNALTKNWVARDTISLRDNIPQADYQRYQYGVSAGGPFGERFRFFGSFEGNQQDRNYAVNIQAPAPGTPDYRPALDTVNFAKYNGSFGSPFRSVLTFGKVTFLQNERSTFDLSFNGRQERDIRDFQNLKAYSVATKFRNDVNTGILKHTYSNGDLLSEATGSFQLYRYKTNPNSNEVVNRFYGFGCCAEIGAFRTQQDFQQRRASLREDLTYSGWQAAGSHVLKGGMNLDFLRYNVIKRNNEIPRYTYELWFDSARTPEKVEFETGDPKYSDNNTQFGAYLQDDWSPVQRLTFNLGVRWDYESNMLNRNFRTPNDVVDSLTKYSDSLFIPLDPSRYFSNGNQRKPYLGAIQPRVGLSYAIDQAERTTVFAGWGRYVDRTVFDITTLEKFKIQHPSYTIHLYDPATMPADPNRAAFDPSFLTRGKEATDSLAQLAQFNTREVDLMPNDLKPPMSNQFTFGVRQLFGTWALEAAYTGVRSQHTPTFYWANENFTCPNPAWGQPNCFHHRNVPGFGNVLLLDDAGKTWYDALAMKLDRTYRRRSENFGWGAGIAYTFAKRAKQGFNDQYSFPNGSYFPKQAVNDERHRIVSNFIVDMPYLWGAQLSGLLTLGSGLPYNRGGQFDCQRADPNNANSCTIITWYPNSGLPPQHSFFGLGHWAYRDLDLRLRKDFFAYRGNRVGVTADVFNVFNYRNLSDFRNAYLPTDPNFGFAGGTLTDPRRFQLGMEYDF